MNLYIIILKCILIHLYPVFDLFVSASFIHHWCVPNRWLWLCVQVPIVKIRNLVGKEGITFQNMVRHWVTETETLSHSNWVIETESLRNSQFQFCTWVSFLLLEVLFVFKVLTQTLKKFKICDLDCVCVCVRVCVCVCLCMCVCVCMCMCVCPSQAIPLKQLKSSLSNLAQWLPQTWECIMC